MLGSLNIATTTTKTTTQTTDEVAEVEITPDDVDKTIPTLIHDPNKLLQYGIVRVKLPISIQQKCKEWSKRLSNVPLTAMSMEGDNEYPLYQNILDEVLDDEDDSDFSSLQDIFNNEDDDNDNSEETTPKSNYSSSTYNISNHLPSISDALSQYFDIQNPTQELNLDDAFGIHYNDKQHFTHGTKHQDPSDITINICLYKSNTVKDSSHVIFHGHRQLHNVPRMEQDDNNNDTSSLSSFMVEQIPNTATIHYGNHLHETTSLKGNGCRTNIILTYWYTQRPSNVAIRSCYDNTTTTTATNTGKMK